MNVLTPRPALRLLLPLLALLLTGAERLMATEAKVTFTTRRGTSATKDWTPDNNTATLDGKTLTIAALTSTGRTDYPYQGLYIVIANYEGPKTYRLTASTYFEDLFGSTLKKTTFQSGSITLESDPATGGIVGTFEMFLTSSPPTSESFTTRIYNGKVSITPTKLILEPKTTRDTMRARAGETGLQIKVIAKNEFGGTVKGVSIVTQNPVAAEAPEVATTDDNGEFLYSFNVDPDATSGRYLIRFNGTKQKFEASPEARKVIEISSRYWTYKCAGASLITFDAGEGNVFEGREAPSTLLDASGSTVLVGSFVRFDGKMSIDTARKALLYEGRFYVPDIPLPGGSTGRLTLGESGTGEFLLNCDAMFKYALPQIVNVKLGGLTISLDDFALVETGAENGVRLKVKAELEDLETGCSEGNSPDKASIAGTMVVSPAGVQSWAVEASNGLFLNPWFCMNDLKIAYDVQEDSWTAAAGVQIKGGLTEDATKLKGGFKIIKGVLDAANADFESATCVQIPDIPFQLCGGRLGFTGLSTGIFSKKGGSINAGLLFTSSEQIILDKFSWIGKLLGGNPQVAEINLDGKWTYPLKFSATAKMSLIKFPKISVTKPWQIDLSGSIELDVDKGLTYSPSNVQAFHFGADDYFITAQSGQVRWGWDNDYTFEQTYGSVTLRIPDVPDDAVENTARAILKYLKAKGVLPATLGTASAYISLGVVGGLKAEAFCDVSSNPVGVINQLGRMGVKLELSEKTNSNLKFTISGGNSELFSLGGRTRRKGSEIQSGGRDLPGPFVAHALDTFMVGAGLERMNILIEGMTSAPPVAYLIAPNGTRYDVSTSNSSVIIPQDTPGNVRWLTVVNPAPGAWILGLVNPKTTDSVTVILPAGSTRSFAVTAAPAAGRKVVVTWNPAGMTDDDLVAVSLENILGEDGLLVGMVRATDGRFEYTFDDRHTECSYNVSATLSGSGYLPVKAFAAGEIPTGKSILPAPTNISVLTNSIGHATVSWSPSPDPTVRNYLIYVRDGQMRDSLLATVLAYETSVRVVADTARLRTLYIRSADINGLLGCAATVSSVGVSGVENPARTGADAAISAVRVVPNPVGSSASIRWQTDRVAPVVIEIQDIRGTTVARIDAGRSVDGANEVLWKTDGIAPGTYFAVVHAGSQMHTTKFVVAR